MHSTRLIVGLFVCLLLLVWLEVEVKVGFDHAQAQEAKHINNNEQQRAHNTRTNTTQDTTTQTEKLQSTVNSQIRNEQRINASILARAQHITRRAHTAQVNKAIERVLSNVQHREFEFARQRAEREPGANGCQNQSAVTCHHIMHAHPVVLRHVLSLKWQTFSRWQSIA